MSVILCATAYAQDQLATVRRAGPIRDAGVYHVATGTWTRSASGTANLGPDTIYKNTAPSGYFTTAGLETAQDNVQLVDEGRIPTFGGSIVGADRTTYELNGITFSYCTEVAAPTVRVTFSVFESYLPCSLISTDRPTTQFSGSAIGTGLPGGGAPGANACWTVTLDLEGVGEFCVEGDGGALAPGFDNDLNLDSFGFSWEFTGQFGQATGPMIAGDPNFTATVPGSILGIGGTGTYYSTGVPSCADTGLDTQDFLALDGDVFGGPACRFFGGYKNTNGCMTQTNTPYASLSYSLIAAAGECDLEPPNEAFCDPAGVNSSGTSAAISAVQTPPSANLAGIRLTATGGPTLPGGGFGFFLVSSNNSASLPIGAGTLCLASPQGRYSPATGGLGNSFGQFDSNGDFVNLAGTSTTGFGFDVPVQLPNPPGGNITAGSTWHFQLWYRDTGIVNFSNGVSVNF